MTEAWFFTILDGSRSHSALIIARTFGPSMHLIIKKKKRQNNNIIVAILEFLRLLIPAVVGKVLLCFSKANHITNPPFHC